MEGFGQVKFEYGDPKKPRGNALAYWRIKARLDGLEFERLIATNFVISPLYLGQQSVAATFPPQLVESREDLLLLAKKANLDLILVKEVSLVGSEFNFEIFFKQQLSFFNRLVAIYTEQYGKTLGKIKGEKQEEPPASQLEVLKDVKRLVRLARHAYLTYGNSLKARELLIKIRRVSQNLSSTVSKYEIEKLLLELDNPDARIDRLARLFFQKHLAVHTEQYEKAARLNQEIQSLNQELSRHEKKSLGEES